MINLLSSIQQFLIFRSVFSFALQTTKTEKCLREQNEWQGTDNYNDTGQDYVCGNKKVEKVYSPYSAVWNVPLKFGDNLNMAIILNAIQFI